MFLHNQLTRMTLAMKYILFFLTTFFLLGTFSCSEEEGNEEIKFPTVILLDEPGFATGNIKVKAGDSFKVKMKAVKGTFGIGKMRLFEGSALIPINRLLIKGISPQSNPFEVVGGDKNGFIYEIEVTTKMRCLLQSTPFMWRMK